MLNLRLMIAEDDIDLADLLSQRFIRLGAEVACCGDADECLRLVDTWEPEVVILDGRLSGNDGLWLARQLQACRPNIPLLMLSGNSDRSFMAAACEAGIGRFLSKPCRFAEIEAAVREAAQQAKLSADHATAKLGTC